MTPEDLRIAKILKKKLSIVTPLLDFRVFGSRARGDMEEYSDMDVFIEVPFVDKVLKRKITEISWEVGIDNSRVICVLVFTKEKIEDYLSHKSSLIQNIFREGVQIAV